MRLPKCMEDMTMMAKRILAALLAAMLLCCAAACAESEDPFANDDEFDFEFVDEGYEGDWIEIEELSIELCLPEGWTPIQAEAGAAYAAVSADGSAGLSIRVAARDVDDVAAWGKENLEAFETDEANFYDVLVVEEQAAVTIYADVSEDGLLAFDFTRADGEALSREFALQIVGTACAVWADADLLVGDADGFDFGEAFEKDPD